jgi:zinc finger protein
MDEPSSTSLEKLREEIIQCPVCGKKTLRIEDYLYEVPYVGKIIITKAYCSNCGYRFTDVRLYQARKPGKIVFPVEKPEDLNVLVVRSASAAVVIPELGLSMTPGPASEGFITTVEGILNRFLEALHAACNSPDADKEACKKMEKTILDAKEGKLRFTLVIVDPEGVSTIVSEKARREPVTKEELEELGYVVAGQGHGAEKGSS